ncbi:resolvase domain protein [Mycobacterium phage Dori]|uniref:resolvase domain protein n=1 Tax=Mycobacterium phage Dori TaxID=1089121 RepID=UPI000232F590|nr:resolvase domain protein [Mycobacterium phage Dori]AER47739.1 resolvase domain protein [Mycobacterium phage Dori]
MTREYATWPPIRAGQPRLEFSSAVWWSWPALREALAEFERSMIRERQREGIALAKARGVCTDLICPV